MFPTAALFMAVEDGRPACAVSVFLGVSMLQIVASVEMVGGADNDAEGYACAAESVLEYSPLPPDACGRCGTCGMCGTCDTGTDCPPTKECALLPLPP